MTRAIELSQLGSNITVDDSGRVGIATDTPHTTRKLTLHGASNYEAGVMLMQSSANIFSLMAEGGTGHVYYDTVGVTASNLGDHIFRVKNGTEGLRVRSNGDLILGPYATSTSSFNVPYQIKAAPYNWANGSEIAAISMGNHSGSTGNDEGEIVFKTALNVHSSSTGLEERMRIDSFGNIGIGTDNPLEKLQVAGVVRIGVNTPTHETFRFTTQGADEAKLIMKDASNNEDVVINTGGLSWFNGGNVGIGTDNPVTELHVQGNNGYAELRLSGQSGSGATIEFYDAASKLSDFYTDPSSNIIFRNTSSNTERLRINSTGNVGIGTTDPQSKLDVKGDITIRPSDGDVNNTAPTLKFGLTDNHNQQKTSIIANPSGDGWGRHDLHFCVDSVADLNNVALSDSKLVIKNNGSVGIGTASPYTPTKLSITPNNRQTQFDASSGSTWHDVVIKQNDTNASGGNAVGLAFEISTDAYHNNAGTGIAAIKDSNSNDYGCHLAFITRPHAAVAEERMRIAADGRVGIGTNAPTTQLDVRENDTRGAIRIGGDNSTGHRIFIQANGYNGSYIDSYGGDQYRKLKIAASPIALTGGDITLGEFDVTDTRNSGGLHIKQSAGVSFTANSGQSVSRNWRVRNDDHGWGNLDFSVGSSNTTWGDTGADAVLSLTSSKNVGINSTSPTHKLDIVGGVSQQLQITGTEADLWLKSTGPGGTYRILGSTGTNTHRFRIYDETNSLDRLNILSDGKIFFGNNTQTALGSASKDYCDIDAHCSGPMSIGSNGPSTHNTELKLVGRKIVNWYWYGYVNTGNTYAHLRTSLWGGGSPLGQIHYIMGGFRIEGYQYTGSATSVEYIMFHNWSGALAGYSRYHHGTYDPGNTVYVDSTGYVTIRLVNSTYKGFSIDLIQQPWYPVRDIRVTDIINSNSTSI